MRSVHLLLVVLLTLLVAQAHADIVVTTLPIDTSTSWGGFWLGTAKGFSGTTHYMAVAQQFPVMSDYTAISADLLLSGSPSNDVLNVAVALTADSSGLPGSIPLAASIISIPGYAYPPSIYGVAFPGVTLLAGHDYWLVATSDAYSDSSGSVVVGWTPVWVAGGSPSLPMVYIHGEPGALSPWEIVNNTLGFSVHGNPVPGPPGLLLLASGLATLGTLAWRRRR